MRKEGKQILSEEQIKELEEQGVQRMEYEQVQNEKALYIHPVTKHKVANWVDDVLARGKNKHNREFFTQMEKRFEMKSWGAIEEGKPRIYGAKRVNTYRDEKRVRWSFGAHQRKNLVSS